MQSTAVDFFLFCLLCYGWKYDIQIIENTKDLDNRARKDYLWCERLNSMKQNEGEQQLPRQDTAQNAIVRIVPTPISELNNITQTEKSLTVTIVTEDNADFLREIEDEIAKLTEAQRNLVQTFADKSVKSSKNLLYLCKLNDGTDTFYTRVKIIQRNLMKRCCTIKFIDYNTTSTVMQLREKINSKKS